jgi:hypothetical protein
MMCVVSGLYRTPTQAKQKWIKWFFLVAPGRRLTSCSRRAAARGFGDLIVMGLSVAVLRQKPLRPGRTWSHIFNFPLTGEKNWFASANPVDRVVLRKAEKKPRHENQDEHKRG